MYKTSCTTHTILYAIHGTWYTMQIYMYIAITLKKSTNMILPFISIADKDIPESTLTCTIHKFTKL